MPELGDDASTLGVNRVDDATPAVEGFFAVHVWHAGIVDCCRVIDRDALGEDQAVPPAARRR